ncbi:MAG: DUF4920 domain-containing protein [Cyclobacteriaceae bacterium]|nr:DUF4920 domain-containing protein [Cyclobacteriaceae bacterium]
MNYSKIFRYGVLVILLTGCQQSSSNYQNFGARLDENNVKALDVLSQLDADDTISVKLGGVVTDVCQSKGCWMVLENPGDDPIRVTFKDYGFFVPKDISGKYVIVEGVVRKSILGEKEARHFAEDAGQIYDSLRVYSEYSFVANGVLLANEAGN